MGHALLFDFTLEGLNPGVEVFFSRYGEFTLMVYLYLTLPESDAETLQFWLQSETIRDGYFDIYRLDDESVHMAYSDIRITPYWGLLQTPLLDSVESGTYWISMALHIPENRIREALGTGTLTVSLGLDEIGIAAPPGA